jgi:O-succinylbenzoic acid--CoA ligase
MRALRVVPAGDAVLPALRDALAGGDALMVAAPGGSAAARATAEPAERPADLPAAVEQRIALVVETSGSTGRPKRVALSADALLANAAASESALGPPGAWVLALPTHYIAGLNVLTRALAAEAPIATVRGEHFTAEAFRAAVAELDHPDRYVSLVPAQLATLLDDGGAAGDLARFRAVLVGGQATPQTLVDRATAHGIRVVRSYGSSETSGGCVYDGVPVGRTAVRVVDGEVQLGGPTIAEGYLGDPALTDERFVTDADGRWFRTADAGQWNGERLTVTGRRDDVLISGGVKVALGAIERMLRERPGWTSAVVVAARDPRWGEVPVVAVEGAPVDTVAAIADAGAALGPAARPARVLELDRIPLLPSGKPDRAAVRRLAEDASRAD